ncbi:probable ion channel POLLUX at N-terminal half [Coccomyxa sp. Obi]|nr:probable ion channel POLLUX at N-terminal half [Coccomyxa sp. Obi]
MHTRPRVLPCGPANFGVAGNPGRKISCPSSPNGSGGGPRSNGVSRKGDPEDSSYTSSTPNADNDWAAKRRQYVVDEWVEAFDVPMSERLSQSQLPSWSNWHWKDLGERIAYKYFCWRQDTWSDLQLFAVVNLAVIFLFGWLKTHLVDAADSISPEELENKPFWLSIYQILQVIFGQQLPDEATSFAQQSFAVSVAAIGLAAFALVLALVEQVVLQVVDENVARGSRVFETGHILVLGFCDSQRDLEVVQKILSQVCQAYAADGGRVVVVMTQREKIGMEALFRRVIPPHKRCGCNFVFRQGSPLVPADLKMVAAYSAAATVIVSDSSRSPVEADAEAIRSAILLDEMEAPGAMRGGRIIVEVKTLNALAVLQYSCSVRVMALHTGEMNARRLSRMVRSPIVAAISYMVWNYSCRPQVYLQRLPELVGKTFGELQFYLPWATVYGLVQYATRRCVLNPPADTRVENLDELILIRATDLREHEIVPLPEPVRVDPGEWDPEAYRSRAGTSGTDEDWSEMGIDERQLQMVGFSGRVRANAASAQLAQERQTSYMYIMPQEHCASPEARETVLICGWREEAFMSDLLREMDHGPSALPAGSSLTLFNNTSTDEVIARVKKRNRLRNLEVEYVSGNPLDYVELTAKIDVTRYTTAIVLCDQSWVDPDLDDSNGIQVREQRDMLRLESQILLVQLHIRKSLMEAGYPDINIICEKVAAEGETRFEDRYRLPIGISVNMTSFSAKLLTSTLYNPRNVLVFAQMGDGNELDVQSAAAFAKPGEVLSYWQLQARAMSVGRILFGYYRVPDSPSEPIDFTVNLEGEAQRSAMRVDLVRTGSSKLVSCGSLQPWAPGELPARPLWLSIDSADEEY